MMTDDAFVPSSGDDSSASDGQNERNSGTARKSTIYELFVLGELMDGPHHGYGLREILSRMFGPFRQISWGVLYPLIKQLEREELIVTGQEQEAGSKQRKAYYITESGRKRFHDLMQEQGEYGPDYPEYFIVKLNNFDHVSLAQQLAILWHYEGYLRAIHFSLQSGQHYVSTSSDIPDNQRGHILRTISYRMSSVQADNAWVEREIASLEEQEEERRS